MLLKGMSVRAFAFASLWLSVLSSGCASGPCSTGWRFECGKPGLVTTQMPYQQSSGGLGILPMGTVGLDSRVQVVGTTRFADDQAPEVLSMPRSFGTLGTRRAVVSASDCTMEEICTLLRALADAQGINTMGSKKMPRSKD